MAYSYTNSKGQAYYLHKKDVTLKNGRQQTIFYFARDVRDGNLDAVPAGYTVVETATYRHAGLKESLSFLLVYCREQPTCLWVGCE
jgi:hypothetical protein